MANRGCCDRGRRERRRGGADRCSGLRPYRDSKLDVSDRAACDAVAGMIRADIGQASVLVNNADIIRRGKLGSETARADWDTTLAVNLDGRSIWLRYFWTS